MIPQSFMTCTPDWWLKVGTSSLAMQVQQQSKGNCHQEETTREMSSSILALCPVTLYVQRAEEHIHMSPRGVYRES